jgi:hypothetical protein
MEEGVLVPQSQALAAITHLTLLSLSHLHVSTGYQGHPGIPTKELHHSTLASVISGVKPTARSHGTLIFRRPGSKRHEHGARRVCCLLPLLRSRMAVPELDSLSCAPVAPFTVHNTIPSPWLCETPFLLLCQQRPGPPWHAQNINCVLI